MGDGDPGRHMRLLRGDAGVRRASPFVTQTAPADGRGLNPSLQNPYMVAHPPALYLGYVGLAIPFAFCMAALLARPHGRALDRVDAPLDAGRLGIPRRRHAARRPLGLRRGRLGRLLGLGSGRERRADAVADGHGVPALGDGAGEEGHAEGLERGAGDASRSRSRSSARSSPAAASCRRSTRSCQSNVGLLVHRATSRSSLVLATSLIIWQLPLLRSEHRHGVARLARGHVPVQQPAARRRSRSRCSGACCSRSSRRRCGRRQLDGLRRRSSTSSRSRSGCR